MFIVSDEVLERLTCSQCNKYLSVYPVKVYPNRAIKCGRCTEPFDAGVISLFGLLAEKQLFRCVNRFEGCYQLLNYKEVAEHEKTCIGGLYECPACLGTFTGTGYEIFMHFKEQHKDELLIDSSQFVLNLDNEQYRCYMHRKNDLLFFVYASYYRSEKEIILSILYLGKDRDAAKIYQMFTLLSVNGKIIHKSKRKCCSSVTGKNTNYFNIAIKKSNFVKNVVICKFELIMEDMGTMLMLPSTVHKTTPFRFDSHPFDKNQDNSNNEFIRPSFSSLTGSFATLVSNSTGSASYNRPQYGEKKEESISHIITTPRFSLQKGLNNGFISYDSTKRIGNFYPVVGSDVSLINGSMKDIVGTMHSITLMEEYNKHSFEELRLAYYQTQVKKEK